jgi:hypothetical protein
VCHHVNGFETNLHVADSLQPNGLKFIHQQMVGSGAYGFFDIPNLFAVSTVHEKCGSH